MNILLYILRVIYRIRLWLLFIPLIVTLLAIIATRNMQRTYQVNTTIYTGIASGFSIESSDANIDWNTVNNAMDNLINIIRSRVTLKRVSLRLYAQHMIHGDPNNDNNYISAAHYRSILDRTPKDVLARIDKTSEENTVNNLLAYERPDPNNFIYGLFNWHHPHYSFEALSKVVVRRLSNSDMLDISYEANDPGIAYNTLVILNEEFVDQYLQLRFGQTNNVIKYFQEQLALTKAKLTHAEDSLTNYFISKHIINYDEQTKHIAALGRDFEIRYEDILLAHESSAALLEELEKHISEKAKQILNNGLFIKQLHNISDLATKITRIESFNSDTLISNSNQETLLNYKSQLDKAEADFAAFTAPYMAQKFTKEGISTDDMVVEWLTQLLRHTKAAAEMEVMRMRRKELNQQYVYYSPIGSTIKRIERDINFTQEAYLNILHNLNSAMQRLRNLEMTGATLKVLNPPVYPVDAIPTARKLIVALAFFGSLILVLLYFLILEILDHTLRDKSRTERLTNLRVLGAFPNQGKLKYRGYAKECMRIATNYLSSSLLNNINPAKKTNIINLISTEDGDGKNFMATQLYDYWTSLGMNVKVLAWDNDLDADPKKYALASSVSDLYENQGEDVIIINHPPMKQSSIPTALLEEGSINLVAARADRVWKDTDQMLLERLKVQTGEVPLYIYLTQANRETVENFTGLLPPYTRGRKFVYRIFQLGLTSSR